LTTKHRFSGILVVSRITSTVVICYVIVSIVVVSNSNLILNFGLQEENETMRRDFELRLSAEKSEMLKRSEELEAAMRLRIEAEEVKMKDLLAARETMIELLQSEKAKAEARIEEERRSFDRQFAELEVKFQNIEKEKSKVSSMSALVNLFQWKEFSRGIMKTLIGGGCSS